MFLRVATALDHLVLDLSHTRWGPVVCCLLEGKQPAVVGEPWADRVDLWPGHGRATALHGQQIENPSLGRAMCQARSEQGETGPGPGL